MSKSLLTESLLRRNARKILIRYAYTKKFTFGFKRDCHTNDLLNKKKIQKNKSRMSINTIY